MNPRRQLPGAFILLAILAATPCNGQGANIRAQEQTIICPEAFGDFEDLDQCDKFWRCEDNVATPVLCEDGLVFDPSKEGREDPCDSPFVVDCGPKSFLQEPTNPHEYCPRSHGIFSDPDSTICDRFFTCKRGIPVLSKCTQGLHFNDVNGICDWPANAGRVGCGLKKPESLDGFTCPPVPIVDPVSRVQLNPHPTFPNLDDCQLFFYCLHGVTPMRGACDARLVFNEINGICETPSKVPICSDWFELNPDRIVI